MKKDKQIDRGLKSMDEALERWSKKNEYEYQQGALVMKPGKLKQSALKEGKFQWDKRVGDTIVGTEEPEAGKFSKEKFWIHKQPAWGQLQKGHPFDIRNNRNRKFPKIKRY